MSKLIAYLNNNINKLIIFSKIMKKIPLSEKFKIGLVKTAKDFIQLSYYLLWILFDPRKFTIIKKDKIKNILVICGGAIGDIYNVIGVINSVVAKYKVNVYVLTYEKNKDFIKNNKIKYANLKESKEMIDAKKIDAAVLIDPARERKIFDGELFLKLLKVPYVVSSDSIKLHPHKFMRQRFPIFATRKIYPIRANGPKTFVNLFNILSLKIDKPSFYFTKEGENFSKTFMKKNNISKKNNLVIVHPGAGKITKALKEGKPPAHLWPEERWAKLIDKILKDKETKIVITGVNSEEIITKKIYNMIGDKKRVVYAVGKIPDIESLASLVKRADATVTPDTSMAHISSHVETPAVILYSSASPGRVGPVSTKNLNIYHKDKAHDCRKYACKYCYEIHMKSISVNEIYSALKKIMH